MNVGDEILTHISWGLRDPPSSHVVSEAYRITLTFGDQNDKKMSITADSDRIHGGFNFNEILDLINQIEVVRNRKMNEYFEGLKLIDVRNLGKSNLGETMEHEIYQIMTGS